MILLKPLQELYKSLVRPKRKRGYAAVIRVKEFADKCNCSTQNIYLHLRNYKTELEGHVFKDRRGTLLDEFAQEFIQGVMYPKQIAAPEAVNDELNKLRATVLELSQRNSELSAANNSLEYELKNNAFLLQAAQNAEADLEQQKEELKDKLEKAEGDIAKAKGDALAKAQELEEEQSYAAALEEYCSRSAWYRLTHKAPIRNKEQDDGEDEGTVT